MLLTAEMAGPSAGTNPAPIPLLWERTYLAEAPISHDELVLEILAECGRDLERGLRENPVTGGPRIAAIGDSVQSQMRGPAMADPAIHWMYASHCGEKFASALDSGRVSDSLASDPDVLVIGLGSNNLSDFFHVDISLLPGALSDLQRLLDATEGARCRVMYTLPDVANAQAYDYEKPVWLYMTSQLNAAIRAAAATRRNLYVADWAAATAGDWSSLIPDGLHLSRKGTNTKMNLAIAAARRCWAPDTPVNLGAVPGNGTATVWWDALPEQEKVTAYSITSSDGRTILTNQPTVNFPGLTNGVAYQFQVRAWNQSGASTASAWTGPVVPSPAGSRYRSTTPVRVLDTRSGTGGKSTSFAPGETVELSLAGLLPAGASAVTLNLTATGQTEQTFVTAWPGGQSRPLVSNLNPRPGVAAVPAMVTTRVSADGAIQLFNNSGRVHLIADLIGWYGPAGDASGALYAPLEPTRVLDTRTGEGGKDTPFGAADQHALALPQLPPGATAAVVNVTSTDTTGPTHVTVWPDGQPQPLASSLNPQPGLTRANLTVSRTGPGNKIRLYNHSSSTNLVVDLVGYYTAEGASGGGSLYFPITPERLYDTRDGTGGVRGPIPNTTSLSLAFAGSGAVPTSAVSAVDANFTVVGPTGHVHTTVWPSGPRPNTSVLNYSPTEVLANRSSTTLAVGRALAWSSAPSTDYVVDVAGWFGPAS